MKGPAALGSHGEADTIVFSDQGEPADGQRWAWFLDPELLPFRDVWNSAIRYLEVWRPVIRTIYLGEKISPKRPWKIAAQADSMSPTAKNAWKPAAASTMTMRMGYTGRRGSGSVPMTTS